MRGERRNICFVTHKVFVRGTSDLDREVRAVKAIQESRSELQSLVQIPSSIHYRRTRGKHMAAEVGTTFPSIPSS